MLYVFRFFVNSWTNKHPNWNVEVIINRYIFREIHGNSPSFSAAATLKQIRTKDGRPHYNLNIQSISVNGQALQIDASVFATSKDRGTIIDSGTTLAYLAEEAYDPFVNTISIAIPNSVRTIVSRGYQCFLTTSSVIDIFPQVSLNFAGGASLNLRPQEYLIQHNSVFSAHSYVGKSFSDESWNGLGSAQSQRHVKTWFWAKLWSLASLQPKSREHICQRLGIANRCISFCTLKGRGTIIDSRKTLAYLAEEAYDPFVNAITAAMPKSVHTFLFVGNQCFLTTNSITDFFPQVNLNFAGGASLDLRPQDYLIQPIDGGSVWCIGFQKIKSQRVTILGDLLLKDKIVVYDLDGQRIGWDDYDCSLPDNVCTAIGTSKHVNTGKTSGSTCLHDGLITSFFVTLILCFVYF
ncbi:aspartic proteinase [Trifolium repens]|nr:aspartic proteinase [Trifolium repens]